MLSSILLMGCLIAADPGHPLAGRGSVSKAEVDNLVLMLDANEQTVRKSAKEQLIKLGPAVLDLLPARSRSPTRRSSRPFVDIRRTLQDAHGPGRHRRLHGHAPRPDETFPYPCRNPEADGQQHCRPCRSRRKSRRSIRKSRSNSTRRLSGRRGSGAGPGAIIGLSLCAAGGVTACSPRPECPSREGRAAIVGPLRIEPARVRASRDLRSTTPSVLQVGLEAAWEPRLRPISVKLPMDTVKAVDSSGKGVDAYDPQAAPEALPRPGNSAVEMDVALAMPPAGTKEIASLKGSLRVMMLGKVEKFSFANLLKGKQEKRIAAATVR